MKEHKHLGAYGLIIKDDKILLIKKGLYKIVRTMNTLATLYLK